MSLFVQTALHRDFHGVAAAGPFRILPRLLARLAEVGELPEAAQILRSRSMFAGVEANLRQLQEVLRPGDVTPFARELRRFRALADPSVPHDRVLRRIWPRTFPDPAVSLVPQVRLLQDGRPYEAEDPDFPYFPMPALQFGFDPRLFHPPAARHVLKRIFDGPAFREYLARRRIDPRDLRVVAIDHHRFLHRGGTKTTYRVRLGRPGRPSEIAMRIIPTFFSGFVPELAGEAPILRRLTSSAVAHLIPRHPGAGVIPIRRDPPLNYLVFFGEWIEAPSLLDLTEFPELATRLARQALRVFAEAVKRVPLFATADAAPIDIKVIGWNRPSPRFIFFDFGTSPNDPFDVVKVVYYWYHEVSHLIDPGEIVSTLYEVPLFRHPLDLRLNLLKQGQRLINLGYWSLEDEQRESEILHHLWRLTDPAGYEAARKAAADKK